jgi:hypothetical protein
MMRRLDTCEARRQLVEEAQGIAPPQLPADNNITFRVNAVDLEHRLRDVETDCSDRLGPPNHGHPIDDHLNGTYVPVEVPSTASNTDIRVASV